MKSICFSLTKRVLGLTLISFIVSLLASPVCAEWTSVSPPSVSSDWGVWGVNFTSSNEGWAVGPDVTNQRGILLHYSGGTWTSVSPPALSSSLQ